MRVFAVEASVSEVRSGKHSSPPSSLSDEFIKILFDGLSIQLGILILELFREALDLSLVFPLIEGESLESRLWV